MDEIDVIENKISILDNQIEFEEIINIFLSDKYSEDEIQEMDVLGFRKEKGSQINKRFSNIYQLDILTPENAYSVFNVKDGIDFNVKKHLHRFLSHKSLTGGTGSIADGSAELFEYISANAVKNYLGTGSKTIMVGEGKSRLTDVRLNEIVKELYERAGSFDNLPERAQDDGVDFIAYKPIDERNIGSTIVLGQACVGKHAEAKKEIKKRWITEYMNYYIGPPSTLLSVVYYLDETNLKRVHSEFGDAIVFDKGRIMQYYKPGDDIVLDQKIINFIY